MKSPGILWRRLIVLAIGASIALVACQRAVEQTSSTASTAVSDLLKNGEKGTTVEFDAVGAIPEPKHQHVKLSKMDRPDEDHMRWRNGSHHEITITFLNGRWPFMERSGPIVIPVGKASEYFSLSDTVTIGYEYLYTHTPPDSTKIRTEPSVSADP